VTLRSRLILLVAAALTPMALIAAATAMLLVEHEREVRRHGAIERARGAMSAVDAHLRGSIAALETLAASRSLEKGDIAAFHAESQRVLRTQPSWVNVGLNMADKSGVLSNAVYNLGKPEPYVAVDEASFEAVVRSGKPSVGSVAAGTAVRSPTPRVRVPALVDGQVRYVLSAPLNLKVLAGVLEAQRLPEDWVISLLDREQRIIARIPHAPAGVPASDSFRDAVVREPEGWFHGRTLEGRAVYTPYVTSQFSGWVLGIAIPARIVDAYAQRTYTLVGAGILAAFLIGLLLAWLTARRLSAPPA
jgi:hypothetical protein